MYTFTKLHDRHIRVGVGVGPMEFKLYKTTKRTRLMGDRIMLSSRLTRSFRDRIHPSRPAGKLVKIAPTLFNRSAERQHNGIWCRSTH